MSFEESTAAQFDGARTRTLDETFDDVAFIMAEVEEKTRQHRRILSFSRHNRTLNGKTIVYADTYPQRREATYVYARHKWDAKTFLLELDAFLEREFPEWSPRDFPCVLNVNGARISVSSRIPFSAMLPEPSSLRFAKINLPFGPVTIEFGKTRESHLDIRAINSGRLSREIETPLIGCEVTQTEVITALIKRSHWAESSIPMDVLSALLMQVAPTFA